MFCDLSLKSSLCHTQGQRHCQQAAIDIHIPLILTSQASSTQWFHSLKYTIKSAPWRNGMTEAGSMRTCLPQTLGSHIHTHCCYFLLSKYIIQKSHENGRSPVTIALWRFSQGYAHTKNSVSQSVWIVTHPRNYMVLNSVCCIHTYT